MTFDDILDQILALLRHQGRVSYWVLKRRFDLHDDDGLDWVLLPNPHHQSFADCPVRQPDVALVDILAK